VWAFSLTMILGAVRPVQAVTPQIASGPNHTLFLTNDGSVWATGINNSGVFGDGTTVSHVTPKPIFFEAVAVSAGDGHSLFLKSDGTAWSTGANSYGQLGDGTTKARVQPVQVMSEVISIAAGANHSLFLKADGTAWAVGRNVYGALGDGTNVSRTTPVQVMSGVVAIHAGIEDSFFVKADGTVWASGQNDLGKLGEGSNAYTYRITPVQTVMRDVVSIASGQGHTLFLKNDGTVWAVGSNYYGQFGNGSTTSKYAPSLVMSGVSAIAAGDYHSLFLKTSGEVLGAGYNLSGQLGFFNTYYAHAYPGGVIDSVQSIAARGNGSLFIKTDGRVWATGYNVDGRLGLGDEKLVYQPEPVAMPPVILSQSEALWVASGAAADLGVKVAGRDLTYQWYRGESGNTAVPIPGAVQANYTTPSLTTSASYWARALNSDGYADSATIKVTVATKPIITVQPKLLTQGAGQPVTLTVSAAGANISYQWYMGLSGVTKMPILGATSATYTTSAGVNGGHYWVRVSNSYGSSDSVTASVNLWDVVAVGEKSFFIKGNGQVWAAGNNGQGAFANGATSERQTPPRKALVDGVIKVSSSGGHSLFLKADGTVYASGENYYGELGDGTTNPCSGSVYVIDGIIDVASGGSHSLFMKGNGEVWATGRNDSGQLGDGTKIQRLSPIYIMDGVKAVAAGYFYSLFLKNDGTVWFAGYDSRIATGYSSYSPCPPVRLIDRVKSMAVADDHVLFLKEDGTVWGVGDNTYGQLGDGTTTQRTTPVQVPISGVIDVKTGTYLTLFLKSDGSLWGTAGDKTPPEKIATGVVADAVGYLHILFVRGDGSVWGAGYNTFGELGDGTTITQFNPVQALLPPLISEQSGGLTINTGTSAILSLSAAGSGPLSYQWYQGSSGDTTFPIAGATTAGYKTPILVQSANYWVRVTNEQGISDSDTMVVTVVPVLMIVTAPQSQTMNAGQDVTFGVNAVAATSYQWKKNGVVIPGATGSSLTLTDLKPTDAGSYTVTVSNAVGTLTSTAAKLTVMVPVPTTVAVPVALKAGRKLTGSALDLSAGMNAAPVGLTYYAKGLPTGLAVDSHTGNVTGVITAKPGVYTVTYWTQMGAFKSATKTFVLTVGAFPAGLTGNYETLMVDPVSELPIGKLELSVAGAVYTGRLTLSGERVVLLLKGSLTLADDDDSASAIWSQTVTVPGQESRVYTLTFTVAAGLSANLLRGTDSFGESMEGSRLYKVVSGVASPWRGTYTLMLSSPVPVDLSDERSFPSSSISATGMIDAKGVLTLSGKLADGTVLTTALQPDVDGHYRLFVKPYAGRDDSSLAGLIELQPHPSLSGRYYVPADSMQDIYWTKAASGDAGYPAGFGPLILSLSLIPRN